MISDSEISRRLHDLADAGGPWDDPLPAIRRRAADPDGMGAEGAQGASNVFQLPVRADGSTPALTSAAKSAETDVDAVGGPIADVTGDAVGHPAGDTGGGDDDSAAGWDAKVFRPDRRRFGWKVPAAAAAVVAGISGVVGLARLIPGPDSMKSASTADSGFQTSAGGAQRESTAAAAGSAEGSSAASAASSSAASSAGAGSAPAATSTAAASGAGYAGPSCSPSVRNTAAVTVTAPAQLRSGRHLSAAVFIGANLRQRGTDVEIYVVGARSEAVVGALRGTVGRSASSATRSPVTLRGTLRRWSCADGNAPSRSSATGRALLPGSYRLVAVLVPADGSTPVAGVPVPIQILSATK